MTVISEHKILIRCATDAQDMYEVTSYGETYMCDLLEAVTPENKSNIIIKPELLNCPFKLFKLISRPRSTHDRANFLP